VEEEFAWELATLRPIAARRIDPRWGACVRGGALAATVPALLVYGLYMALNYADWDMPWFEIGTRVAVFAPFAGISLALFVELAIVAFDRIGRLFWPAKLVANPITAGTLAGALAGIAPGAIGVTVFGSYHGPFVGTASLACACIAGALLVVVPIARRCGARALVLGFAFATLLLCAIATIVAPLVVDSAFAEIRDELRTNGPVVGASCGVIGGGIMGCYVGLVIAIGRAFGRRSQRTR
jgi:hypothetical protein